jgi:hypothetical protein
LGRGGSKEVIQNLIESGKLQGSKGAYRLVTPVHKLEVPSELTEALLESSRGRPKLGFTLWNLSAGSDKAPGILLITALFGVGEVLNPFAE